MTALIDRGASVIVLTETGTLPPDTTAALVDWVENGGTLVRFASPNLAATTVDELLPVRLRQGERALGGSLSWEEPQPIGSFPADGPFAAYRGARRRAVNRQVLADPDALREARRLGGASRRHAARHRRRARRRAASSSSTSPPIRAGRTCRSPARSSRC